MATTWNPSDKSAGCTLSGGNLVATFPSNNSGVRSVDRVYSGKYYWEVTYTTFVSSSGAGVVLGTSALGSDGTSNLFIIVYGSGTIALNGAATGLNIGSFSGGAVCCFALDATNDLFWARNGAAGNWNNGASNNPATGVGGISIASFGAGPMGLYAWAMAAGISGAAFTVNFGATAFTGAVPAGFTSGFPDSTVMTNLIMESGLAREALYTTNAALTASGIAREVLLITPTALTMASVAREVLLLSPPPAPPSTAGKQSMVSLNVG
jgi:hypothetical protein